MENNIKILITFFDKQIEGNSVEEIKNKIRDLQPEGTFESNYCHVYLYLSDKIYKHWTLELSSKLKPSSSDKNKSYYTNQITDEDLKKLFGYLEEDTKKLVSTKC